MAYIKMDLMDQYNTITTSILTFKGKKVTFNFIYLLLPSETYTDTNDEPSHLERSLGKPTNSKPSMEPNQEMQFPDRSATWNGFTLRLDVVPVHFNATKTLAILSSLLTL